MCVLDQNNKYGIQDSGLLVESDVLEQSQWYGVDSSLDFSSIVGVKDPFLINWGHIYNAMDPETDPKIEPNSVTAWDSNLDKRLRW